MRAKPGKAHELFELATAGLEKSGASDRYTLVREAGDPDVLWNIEVFRPIEDKEEYENSELADALREPILALLDTSEPPLRIEAHVYASIPNVDPA